MITMALFDLKTLLENNTYPGRGIVIGKSADGKNAMIAYFIMGRSENSRNRIFERYAGGMRTKAFDESKLSDPSLIIYNPFLETEGIDVITNGDQTDTVMDYIKANEVKFFEVDFGDDTEAERICIKYRGDLLTVEDASRFCKKDEERIGHKVTAVYPIMRREAEALYDFSKEDKWPVFPLDNEKEM